MTKRVSLKSDVSLNRERGYIAVTLSVLTSDDNSRWPKKEIIDCKLIYLRYLGFIFMKDVNTIAREIVNAQNNQLARYKANHAHLSRVEKLAAAYSGGEIVVQDPKTGQMIDFFVGKNTK